MANEINIIQHMLDDLRGQVVELVRPLSAEALNWRPPLPEDADPTNSLGVLAVHLAGAEHHWIGEVVGGLPPTRDRDAEFAFVAESAEEPMDRLAAVAEESRGVLNGLTLEALEGVRPRQGASVPVRWALLHVVEHYGLHLGHMELTYQLWSGGKARQGPRLAERLPG